MEKKKYNFLYKTINIFEYKEYIGVHSTNNLNDDYLGSSKDLISDITRLGPQNFKREILFNCKTREEAFEKEKEIVNSSYILREDTYNKMLGGWYSHDMAGWKWIYLEKFNVRKRVPLDCYEDWKNEGWIDLVEVWINKNDVTKRIPKVLLKKYLNEGWLLGCGFNQNRITMSKDGKEKMIPKNEFEKYIEAGWQNKSLKKVALGKIRINKNGERKSVLKDKLQQYLNDGWVLGEGKTENKSGGKYITSPDYKVVKRIKDKEELKKLLSEGWHSKRKTTSLILYKGEDKIVLKGIELSLKDKYLLEGWKFKSHTKGLILVHNEILKRNKLIKKQELDYYLYNGWIKVKK